MYHDLLVMGAKRGGMCIVTGEYKYNGRAMILREWYVP